MKAIISNDMPFLGVDLYLYEEKMGTRYLMTEIKDGHGKMEEVKEGQMVKPTLRIPEYEAQELLISLAEALDKKGIKTDNDHRIAGVLEATKYHLEDMRKMVRVIKK